MVEKKISIYSEVEAQSPFNNDILIIEVSNNHIALLAKLAGKNTIAGFELFEFESTDDDWYNVFYRVRTNSTILNRGFNDTRLYFNNNESVLTPADKFSGNNAEEYLQLIHGDNTSHVVKYDNVNINPALVNIYRIKRALNDIINTNLMMVTSRHIYSNIIESLLNGNRFFDSNFIKLQFYHHHFIVTVIKYNKLQLIQSYNYSNSDDILYYLLNVTQQFSLPTDDTQVEISGFIDLKSHQYEYIRKVFSKITFENIGRDTIFKDHLTLYPAHYFTPFLNLAG
jgi:hypothetical protein